MSWLKISKILTLLLWIKKDSRFNFGYASLFKNNKFDVVFHMQKSLRSKLIGNIINGRVNVTFNDIETRGRM